MATDFGECWRRLAQVVLVLGSSFSASAGTPPDCNHHHCGLLTDGPYANLVIGTLSHVGSDGDMRRVFHWAKTHGYWKNLPATATPYTAGSRLVTITLPGMARTVTVFMQQEEFRSAPYVVGDLVRYTPHDGLREIPPGDGDHLAIYQGLTGCVATLCRREDGECFKRYATGVFTKAHGRPVDLKTGAIKPYGTQIDPVSLLPVH